MKKVSKKEIDDSIVALEAVNEFVRNYKKVHKSYFIPGLFGVMCHLFIEEGYSFEIFKKEISNMVKSSKDQWNN